MHEISLAMTHVFPGVFARGHMYLDPGSGSFLIQILIATLAGAGIFIATSWRKVQSWFKPKTDKKSKLSKENKAAPVAVQKTARKSGKPAVKKTTKTSTTSARKTAGKPKTAKK